MIYRSLIASTKLIVWIGELPEATYVPSEVLREAVPTHNRPQGLNPQKIAVELSIPSGPLHVYGLMGGEFLPRSFGMVDLTLGVLEVDRRGYASSIAPRPETVRVGFPREFSPGVIQGFVKEVDATSLPSGDITINCAAIEAVGSNRLVFRTATQIVVRLIQIPQHLITESVVKDAVQKILVQAGVGRQQERL